MIVAMAGIVRREERRYARTVTCRYILRVQLHRARRVGRVLRRRAL